MEVLEEIRSVVNSTNFDDIIWGSDLNWDPSRKTQFSKKFNMFKEELGLSSLWENFPVPYTHMHTDNVSKSVLDHFLLSPRLLPMVIDCGIVERGDNLSRHCPIWVKLNLESLPSKKNAQKWIPRRPDWKKASPEDKECFKGMLSEKLYQLSLSACEDEAFFCDDVHCKDTTHSESRDILVTDILTAVIETSFVALPVSGGCWVKEGISGVGVPGWNGEVKRLKGDSLYWVRICKYY